MIMFTKVNMESPRFEGQLRGPVAAGKAGGPRGVPPTFASQVRTSRVFVKDGPWLCGTIGGGLGVSGGFPPSQVQLFLGGGWAPSGTGRAVTLGVSPSKSPMFLFAIPKTPVGGPGSLVSRPS